MHLASGKFISNRILAVQFFSIHLAPWFDGFGSEQRILTGTQRVQRTFMSAFQLFSVKPAVPLAALSGLKIRSEGTLFLIRS